MVTITREKSFQGAVVDLAVMLGWRHFAVRDSRGCPAGWPDLVLVRDRLIFRELKTSTGRLTDQQESWGRSLTGAGCDWAVWRPDDWATIEATLRGQLSMWGAA
jgi:hypothetical protein